MGSLTLEAALWPPGAAPQPQGFRAWRWKGLPAPHHGAVSARDTVTARAFPRQPGLLPSRPRAQMVLHLLRSLAIWRGEQRPHPAPVTEKTHTQAPGTKAGAGQQLHSPLLLLRRKHAGPQVLPPLVPSPYSLASAGPVRDTRICTPGMQGLEESDKILTKYLPTKETRDQRKKKRLLTGVGEAGSVPGLPLCEAWESEGNNPAPGTLHPK